MNDVIVSDVWDLYDPNWKERFDHHHKAYSVLQDIPSSQRSPEQQEQYEQHHRGWQDAHVAQFKNASEYADSMIKWIDRMAKNMNLVWVKTDTSKLKTREDAMNAYRDADTMFETQKAAKYNSIPVDTTSGLFNKDRSRSTHEMFVGWAGATIETIMTTEDVDGALNVCLTHLRSNPGTSVVNAAERVATIAYATALQQTYPDPSKVNWYIHVPPTEGMRESFMKVEMGFGDKGYSDATFDHFDKVPEAIKMAMFTAQHTKPRDANNTLNNGTKPIAYLPG